MKKQLLLLGASLLSLASFAQVSNGDFENWTSSFLYESPAPWKTSTAENGGEVNNTTKSTDAQDLVSSVRMESVLDGTDTVFGYTIIGDIGDNGPESGTPYVASGLPDSLIFWVKYDIQSTDSATVIFASSYLGTATGMDVFKWIGTQNTWTRKALKLTTPAFADSVVIAFACSDAMNEYAVPGSWMMVDNISVKTTTTGTWTPPNNSFETWTSKYSEDADDWYSSNDMYTEDTTLFKTADAHSNSYAALIETILSDYDDTIQGALSNAPYDQDNWFTKVPYVAQPATMDLYYKYAPSGTDSAYFQVEFYAAGSSIGNGFYKELNTVGTYTALSVPISFGPGVVDSMRILFMSGDNPGSKLYVDLVSLNGGTVETPEVSLESSVKHFPNPVQDELNVFYQLENSSANGTISIFDINGKLISSRNIAANAGRNLEKFNTQSLPKGIYTYAISINGKKVTKKFVKQ